MALKLRAGDYVPGENGSFRTAEGAEELLERVLFKLQARKGGFPLLPRLGSELYRLPNIRPSQRENMARRFVAEALSDERELEVTDVSLRWEGAGGRLRVGLLWRGQALQAETGI